MFVAQFCHDSKPFSTIFSFVWGCKEDEEECVFHAIEGCSYMIVGLVKSCVPRV